VTASIRVEGVAETLRILQRVDPELRRQLIANLKEVTKPVTNAIKGNYAEELLSGTTRPWAPRGRTIFPYVRQKAVSGVTTKASSSKRNQTLLAITQKDPAASFDTRFPPPSRVMWRSYEQADDQLLREVAKVVDKVTGSLTALQKAIL